MSKSPDDWPEAQFQVPSSYCGGPLFPTPSPGTLQLFITDHTYSKFRKQIAPFLSFCLGKKKAYSPRNWTKKSNRLKEPEADKTILLRTKKSEGEGVCRSAEQVQGEITKIKHRHCLCPKVASHSISSRDFQILQNVSEAPIKVRSTSNWWRDVV